MLAALSGVLLHRLLPDITLIPFLDDNLYVLAGLNYASEKARGNFHWMEVFDSK